MTTLTRKFESECQAFASPDVWAELDTPCTLIAAEVVARNISRMADYCRQHAVSLRPHTKTHKSLRIARMQMDAGAVGLTVAKAGEAVAMAEVTDDILLAYPAFDPARMKILTELARRKTIRVAIDSEEAVTRIGDACRSAGVEIGVLVDLD